MICVKNVNLKNSKREFENLKADVLRRSDKNKFLFFLLNTCDIATHIQYSAWRLAKVCRIGGFESRLL